MKKCNHCHQTFKHDNWHCPHCKHTPQIIDDVAILAPNLQSGFESQYFEPLYQHEDSHFWFESRNHIIIWALKKYFKQMTSFLEVGCGTGFVLRNVHYHWEQLNVVGSEIFLEGLSIAKQRLPEAQFIQMDAQSIPYHEEFDVIGSFDVLEHIADDRTVLNQMYQAVKPGGGLLLSVPQHPQLWSVVDEYGHHQRRYTRAELIEKVSAAGFTVEHVTSFMTLTLPLLYLSRRSTRNQTVEDYNVSQELKLPRLVNWGLRNLLRIEALMIRIGIKLPAGGSLLLVAKRPANDDKS